jgi:hypothetical protein
VSTGHHDTEASPHDTRRVRRRHPRRLQGRAHDPHVSRSVGSRRADGSSRRCSLRSTARRCPRGDEARRQHRVTESSTTGGRAAGAVIGQAQSIKASEHAPGPHTGIRPAQSWRRGRARANCQQQSDPSDDRFGGGHKLVLLTVGGERKGRCERHREEVDGADQRFERAAGRSRRWLAPWRSGPAAPTGGRRMRSSRPAASSRGRRPRNVADALAGSDYRRTMKGIVRSARVRIARSRLYGSRRCGCCFAAIARTETTCDSGAPAGRGVIARTGVRCAATSRRAVKIPHFCRRVPYDSSALGTSRQCRGTAVSRCPRGSHGRIWVVGAFRPWAPRCARDACRARLRRGFVRRCGAG